MSIDSHDTLSEVDNLIAGATGINGSWAGYSIADQAERARLAEHERAIEAESRAEADPGRNRAGPVEQAPARRPPRSSRPPPTTARSPTGRDRPSRVPSAGWLTGLLYPGSEVRAEVVEGTRIPLTCHRARG